MRVLFTCCAIILHNFLEINMDIWKTNYNDDTDDTEEGDNDDDDDYMLRNNNEVLKRTGQAKRNLIFRQHFP